MSNHLNRRAAFQRLSTMAVALGAARVLPARAQAYPSKAITLVVPYTPGGTTDNIVRAIQNKLSEQLGQAVIIENRPGASGNVGNRSVARAAPDGYTIGIMPTTVGTFTLMAQNLGYDPMEDLTYIGGVAETPSIIIVRKDSPVRSFADLVAMARTRSGGINVGSGGVGGAGHLVILTLGKLNNFPVTHVAYKGTAPAVNDLLGGNIDAASMAIGGVKGQVDGGVVRPVLVASVKRNPLLRDVPVMEDMGMKGVNGGVWYVLAVSSKTPREIVERLHGALDRVLQDKEVVERMQSLSFVPTRTTLPEARKMVEEQTTTWAPIIKDLGLKLE
jgi:tripartite-type tricarboxylate transporter receptor subunit TctC